MAEMDRQLLEQFMSLYGTIIRYTHIERMHSPMASSFSGQGRVLKLLRLKPEMTQKELCELMGVRPQSVGELLAKLENSGYVTRVPSETDRRSVVVRLTEKGRQAISEETGGSDLFSALSPEKQQELLDTLRQVEASLSARMPDLGGRGHFGHGFHHGWRRGYGADTQEDSNE